MGTWRLRTCAIAGFLAMLLVGIVIPLALAVAVADGRVKKGNLVLLEAMGGGFTWGSALVRW